MAKKFSAYLENELDSNTKQQLEKHLSECEHCAYEWRVFQNTLSIVKNMPAIEPSADFDRQLRLRLAIEEAHKISLSERLFGGLRNHPVFALSGILAVVVMLSIGMYFYTNPPKFSNDNEFMVRYVMPEIYPKESTEQWRDFNLEQQEPYAEVYLPEMRNFEQPSHETLNTNYILRTVTFTSDSVNKPF